MKTIVFGGSGFVGSHVADALDDAGHEVTVFDLHASKYIRPSQRFISGNILDQEVVQEAVQGQDVVYNFAGIADIGKARRHPLDTVNINLLGNSTVLEASRQAGINRYVFASTVYVYSQSGSFYRVSKQACELYIEEYQKQYGLDYTILRYGTLYGRRANPLNSVHRYLKEALVDRKIHYYGDGEEIRQYIHVVDAARCSVDILDDEFKNQHVILTGHQSMRAKDLLLMIQEIVGTDVQIDLQEPTQDNAHYRVTPYSFNPRIGKKLIKHHYLDLGQGLLDCLEEIHVEALSVHDPGTAEIGVDDIDHRPPEKNGSQKNGSQAARPVSLESLR